MKLVIQSAARWPVGLPGAGWPGRWMTRANGPRSLDSRPAAGTIAERLAPLARAAPEPTRGRIQTLADARSALRIPASAEPDVLRAWGIPSDFELVAFPVADEHRPQLVSEFAVLRVIKRQGRKLIAHQVGSGKRLRLREKGNALWIIYGSIIQASIGTLVIESLSIGPAFDDQPSRKGDDITLGITSELLRFLSPAGLLSQTAEYLQRQGHWIDVASREGAQPMPDTQRDLLQRIEHGRPRQAQISDDQLAEIAKRFISLCVFGLRHPLPHAREFGITRSQARDRIHKARLRKYLGPGQPGRATPTLGPRLKKTGWKPPLPPTAPLPPDQKQTGSSPGYHTVVRNDNAQKDGQVSSFSYCQNCHSLGRGTRRTVAHTIAHPPKESEIPCK